MFTYLFWTATIVFLITSAIIATKSSDPVFYTQVLAGVGMFVGSKIGRTFLGLA